MQDYKSHRKNRVVIVSGGHVSKDLLTLIHETDYIIGADRGALTLASHGYKPDVALGDFDSVTEAEYSLITSVSKMVQAFDPIDKDYTDTELALRTAIRMQPERILLLGATGSRMDHTLANIHLLKHALELGIPMQIVDDTNCIQMMNSTLDIINEGYTYVSLLPITHQVHGIELEGFAYPLHNAVLTMGQSLGISNKLTHEKGTITVTEGILLVIASRD